MDRSAAVRLIWLFWGAIVLLCFVLLFILPKLTGLAA